MKYHDWTKRWLFVILVVAIYLISYLLTGDVSKYADGMIVFLLLSVLVELFAIQSKLNDKEDEKNNIK